MGLVEVPKKLDTPLRIQFYGGAYMTDIIKDFPKTESCNVISYYKK